MNFMIPRITHIANLPDQGALRGLSRSGDTLCLSLPRLYKFYSSILPTEVYKVEKFDISVQFNVLLASTQGLKKEIDHIYYF